MERKIRQSDKDKDKDNDNVGTIPWSEADKSIREQKVTQSDKDKDNDSNIGCNSSDNLRGGPNLALLKHS